MMNDSNVKNTMKFDNGVDNLISYSNNQTVSSSSISQNVIYSQFIINNNNNGKLINNLDYSSQFDSNLISNFLDNGRTFDDITYITNLPQVEIPSNTNQNEATLQRKVNLVNSLEKAKYSNYKRKKNSIKQE